MLSDELKKWTRWMGAWILLVLVAGWLFSATPLLRDDTDAPWPANRSGLALRTDRGTGCQYLESGSGLTPRMDGAGRHMGCRWLVSEEVD